VKKGAASRQTWGKKGRRAAGHGEEGGDEPMYTGKADEPSNTGKRVLPVARLISNSAQYKGSWISIEGEGV